MYELELCRKEEFSLLHSDIYSIIYVSDNIIKLNT